MINMEKIDFYFYMLETLNIFHYHYFRSEKFINI